VGAQTQRPPAYSAIKVDGVPLHRRARRGDEVEAPLRDVTVHALALRSFSATSLALTVRASKGFYVRSLGRDLAHALGTVGHLAALRRTASGAFRLADAVDGDALLAARQDETRRPPIVSRVLGLEAAIGALRSVTLDAAAEADARAGRLVRAVPDDVDVGATVALLGRGGRLVAIGERRADGIAVRRGFRSFAVDA